MDVKEQIAESLRRIRKETGLNQIDFFKEYFLGVIEIPTRGGDIPADDTIQGRMREYENAKRSLPSEALPVLSRLAQCSIDDLFGLTGEQDAKTCMAKTAADVLAFLFDNDHLFSIDVETVSPPYQDGLYQRASIYFYKDELNQALVTWHELKGISFGGDFSIKDDVIQSWKTGELEKNKSVYISTDDLWN